MGGFMGGVFESIDEIVDDTEVIRIDDNSFIIANF